MLQPTASGGRRCPTRVGLHTWCGRRDDKRMEGWTVGFGYPEDGRLRSRAMIGGVHRVAIVGPTSAPWSEIAESIEDDLRHLRRPGVEVSYVTTGAGPIAIRSTDDELAAAPHVVATAERVSGSCDAIIVDCTGDPGVRAAREIVAVPVVGAGEATRRAADRSPAPVIFLSGDEVRSATVAELHERIAGAATVVVDATGQRAIVEALRDDHSIIVIEPLEAAIDWCVELLDRLH